MSLFAISQISFRASVKTFAAVEYALGGNLSRSTDARCARRLQWFPFLAGGIGKKPLYFRETLGVALLTPLGTFLPRLNVRGLDVRATPGVEVVVAKTRDAGALEIPMEWVQSTAAPVLSH